MSDLAVVGGAVALDLVNTVEPRIPGRNDGNEHLRSPDDLLAWALRVNLLDPAEAERVRTAWASTDHGARALAATLELREATYAVMLAVLNSPDQAEGVAERALEVVSGHWTEAISRSSLTLLRPEPTRDRLQVGSDPALLIPDRLGHAVVELLRTLDAGDLKACPLDEGGCGWLFLDQSKNGSRRWCSMADCGARAKARRLTNRRRAARRAEPQ